MHFYASNASERHLKGILSLSPQSGATSGSGPEQIEVEVKKPAATGMARSLPRKAFTPFDTLL